MPGSYLCSWHWAGTWKAISMFLMNEWMNEWRVRGQSCVFIHEYVGWGVLGHDIHTHEIDGDSCFEVLSIKGRDRVFYFFDVLYYDLIDKNTPATWTLSEHLGSPKDNTSLIQARWRFWAFVQIWEGDTKEIFFPLSEPPFLPYIIERLLDHF